MTTDKWGAHVTMPRALEEKIQTLVELRVQAPTFDFGDNDFQGKERFVSTVAWRLLDETIDALVNALPAELQVRFWRRLGEKQRTTLEVFTEAGK